MKYRESATFLFPFRYKAFLRDLARLEATTEPSLPARSIHSQPEYAILFDATINEDKMEVMELAKRLEKTGARVTLMGFLNHAADTSGLSFKHFNKKEVNYFFIPQNAQIDRFLQTHFELLIHADLSQSLPLHFLAARAKAYTKVGPHSDFDRYYHLILDTKDTFTIKQYIRDLIDILNKMVFNGRL
jgi:hypothetical protein